MNSKKSLKLLLIVSLILMIALLSGCSLFKGKGGGEIDPPQVDYEEQTEQSSLLHPESMPENKAQGTMDLTVYYKDKNGFVAPITWEVDRTFEPAKQAIEMMIKGGEVEGKLPTGFEALLPEGTKLQGGIDLFNEVATLDFNRSFKNYDIADERKIMEALTWTMTSFPTINGVQIQVNGEVLYEMPVGGTPMDRTLTRNIGINIEKKPGVHIVQSTPVTLYFASEADGQLYYVPVTRLVDHTRQVAKATITELLAGPSEQSRLHSLFIQDIDTLLDAYYEDAVATLHFNEHFLQGFEEIPSEMLESITLSLSDSLDVEQVQFQFEAGSLPATEYMELKSEPMHAPNEINKFKM